VTSFGISWANSGAEAATTKSAITPDTEHTEEKTFKRLNLRVHRVLCGREMSVVVTTCWDSRVIVYWRPSTGPPRAESARRGD
jgi:hypothetical protein